MHIVDIESIKRISIACAKTAATRFVTKHVSYNTRLVMIDWTH